MSYDEMELDMIGDQKTAMFVIISDTDDTFNFVVAIMYTQLFNLLCDKADDEHGGRLPYHVRLLLDEFSNIGQIPKFDKLIATIRSREISASIILQSQSQLKTIYKDAAETITGNCDTVLFLGGKESSTLKEISETLGKETIDLYNTSDTRGTSQSYGLNYQKTGKELMSRDELAVMDGNKCILQLRGVRPFLSNKYDITKHKRYKELSDADKRNAFDVEKYLEHKLVFSQDQEYHRQVAYIILDSYGKMIMEECQNGFDEKTKQKLHEIMKVPEQREQEHQTYKDRLEHYQKFYENGTYERSWESGTEGNYNMVDGQVNNLKSAEGKRVERKPAQRSEQSSKKKPKKRESVIKRLREKQIAIAVKSGKPVPRYLEQDMERRRG